MKACLVVYDIPARVKMHNPSDMMRRFGVRINLSCWVVPERNVPLLPLAEMREQGARVELVRFDENELEKILRLATQALEVEISRLRAQLNLTLKGVRTRYGDVLKTQDPKQFDKAYLYDYINMRRVKAAVTSAQECAMAFDLTGDFTELFKGMREAIKAADEEVYALHKKAAEKVGKS